MKILSTFMVQGVLNFMLYYIPTPGGSGISEGVGYTLFAPLVPSHILGVFLVIWKFLTNYVWTIVGGLIIVKSIGMKHLEDITKEKEILRKTGNPFPTKVSVGRNALLGMLETLTQDCYLSLKEKRTRLTL